MNLAIEHDGPGPIVVSGFGRCGSSLLMRILDAGGVDVICDPGNRGGSYETELANSVVFHGGSVEWLAQQHGRAIKLLSVGNRTWPEAFRFRLIWIDRDPGEQSRSQAHFMVEEARFPKSEARQIAARLRRSYGADRARTFKRIRPRPILRLTFEGLINKPEIAVVQIIRFLDLKPELARTMVAQVIRRSPKWSRSHIIERSLVRLSAMDATPVWPLREQARWEK